MSHTSSGINTALLSVPSEEVRFILDTILCELYVVEVWEGMVQNSMSCHVIPIIWACSCFRVPFSPHTLYQIVYA